MKPEDKTGKEFDSGYKDRQVFKAPEGYFENLEDRIHARIAQEEKTAPRGKTLHLYRYAVPAVAAALLILAIWAPWEAGDSTENLSSTELLASVSDEEIISYLAESGIYAEEIATQAPSALPDEVEILPEGDDISEDVWEEEILYGDLYDVI